MNIIHKKNILRLVIFSSLALSYPLSAFGQLADIPDVDIVNPTFKPESEWWVLRPSLLLSSRIFKPEWWVQRPSLLLNSRILKPEWWIQRPSLLRNAIFNHNWWVNRPSLFRNDIFNPQWWVTQPSRFVNDIFNRYWPHSQASRFINDIFNPTWLGSQPSKFINDIFRSLISPSENSGTLKSPQQPAPPKTSSSRLKYCVDRYQTAQCWNQCEDTLECLKSCSRQFNQCRTSN